MDTIALTEAHLPHSARLVLRAHLVPRAQQDLTAQSHFHQLWAAQQEDTALLAVHILFYAQQDIIVLLELAMHLHVQMA